MPLLDHFRPPLSELRHWHSFHNAWAANLAASLNRHLPANYFAESNVQFGIEIDVATFEQRPLADAGDSTVDMWTPPKPDHTTALLLEEEVVEVIVFSTEAGPTLVAAIELVSPGNKDRESATETFVSKCETYLHRGLGLAVVDVVTSRHGNLHHALMARLHDPDGARVEADLYATAYRPAADNGTTHLEIWTKSLQLGRVLPVVPLWLRLGPCVPVELEATYQQTCDDHRIT